MKPEIPENTSAQTRSVRANVRKRWQLGLYQLAKMLGSLFNPLPLRSKKYGLLLCSVLSGLYCILLIKGGWQQPVAAAPPVQRLSIPTLQHHLEATPDHILPPGKWHQDSLPGTLKTLERVEAPMLPDTSHPVGDRNYSTQKIKK